MFRKPHPTILGIALAAILLPWSTVAQTTTSESGHLEEIRSAPVVGPGLRRSSALIRLHLRDRDGNILTDADIPGVPAFRLTRLLGHDTLRVWDHHWEPRTGTLVLGAEGLEPGAYVLDLDGGAYGTAHMRFEVIADQVIDKPIRLPGYRRVIAIRCLDEHGRPIELLDSLPHFEPRNKDQSPAPDRGPPKRLTSLGNSDRTRSCRIQPARTWVERKSLAHDEVAQTEGGLFFIPVVAGVEGALVVPVTRARTPVPHHTETTFVGAEWDDFIVRIHDTPAIGSIPANPIIVNSKDPGNRKQASVAPPLVGGERKKTPPWERTATAEGPTARVSVPISRDDAVQLHIAKKIDGEPLEWLPLLATHGDHQTQWCDVPVDTPCLVQFSDGLLYETSWKEVRIDSRSPRTLDAPDRGRPFALDVALPPTLAGMRRPLLVRLSAGGWTHAPWRQTLLRLGKSGQYRLRSSITTEHLAAIERNGGGLSLGFGRFSDSEDPLVVHLPLVPNLIREASGDGALVDLAHVDTGNHMLARCVGGRGEGLPWVEGSIFALENDTLAREVRGTLQHLRAAGRLPRWRNLRDAHADEIAIWTSDLRNITEELRAGVFELLERLDDDSLRRRAGVDLARAFPDSRQLRHFLENGSWYDAWTEIRSDDQGYIVEHVRALIPGRNYVLYLWSKSRDALKPDRRLVFRARPGFTDLGVIALPSY